MACQAGFEPTTLRLVIRLHKIVKIYLRLPPNPENHNSVKTQLQKNWKVCLSLDYCILLPIILLSQRVCIPIHRRVLSAALFASHPVPSLAYPSYLPEPLGA